MSAQNKRCPGIYGKCSKIMPYWDNHKICRACRGYSCSPSTPCEVCSEWTEELWKKLSKCLHRASQAKSVKPKVSSSQAPAKGPASSDESQAPAKGPGSFCLPSGSCPAPAAITTRTTENSSCRELESDLVHQAPGDHNRNPELEGTKAPSSQVPVDIISSPSRKSSSPERHSGKSHSKSVTPMDMAFPRNKSLPRQYASARSARSRSRSIHTDKRRRRKSKSVSSGRSSSSEGRARHSKHRDSRSRHKSRLSHSKRRDSRYTRYHRSRSPRSRSPRSRYHRSRSYRPRSHRSRPLRSKSPRSDRYRHASPRQVRYSRSRSVSKSKVDPAVSALTKLVEQQGQMLKELSSRFDNLSTPTPQVSADKVTVTPLGAENVVDVYNSENEESDPDRFQVRVGDSERIGDSDSDHYEEKGEETPKESLSYKEAIIKLRNRLGPSVCPIPEAKSKAVGASALDFFKDQERSEETSLALPQSNSVSVSLSKMNKRLKGEDEVPMTPLPSYPKGFKIGSFVSLKSKPKIFQASSYESLNPLISMDPPSVNPGLKDIMKQGSSVPSSQAVQFSTLENWEKLARTGMQVASHSEMFLCGTLKTMQQDTLSKDDMLEVSRYLQAVAVSQSHLIEILSRLASGPLLARRDACLAVSDLDSEAKQSLRVQPMESSTIFGEKFPEIVKQYKDGLTHKSLQMAVVGASKQQSSGFKKKGPKVSESSTKSTYGELSVSVGPNASRTANVTQGQGRPFQRNPRRNPVNPGQNKGPKKGKGPKPNAP